MLYVEILFVLILTGINGLLAMSEMAIVSSRKARLEHMASHGSVGAAVALRLVQDPSRLLSTVQIGITLIGILAGAFSGATLADKLGDWLDTFPLFSPYGDTISIGIVVICITYLSLIVGELVPKRAALANPERIAMIIARPMDRLSRIAGPAVSLLGASTEAVLRLLGWSGERDTQVTEEEVKSLIAEGAETGLFEPQEHQMIEGVLRLADRPARAIMTPRNEVVWVDINADREALLQAIQANRYSRLLVCEGSVDHAIGVVHTKDLLPPAIRGEDLPVKTLMVRPVFIPERTPILKLLDDFRRNGVHMAVVVDEYGTTQGVVTATDVLETIAGDLPELGEESEPMIIQRDDGSWLCDGLLPIDEFEDRIGLRGLHDEGSFHTLGGFMIHKLGRLPHAGEHFTYRAARFEVVDMDGRRIDKVLVQIESGFDALDDG